MLTVVLPILEEQEVIVTGYAITIQDISSVSAVLSLLESSSALVSYPQSLLFAVADTLSSEMGGSSGAVSLIKIYLYPLL